MCIRDRAQVANQVSPQIERQIYMRLQEMRQKLAIGNRIKPYTVAGDALLKEIARRAPASLDELDAVQGFSNSGLTKNAAQIVTVIAAIRQSTNK